MRINLFFLLFGISSISKAQDPFLDSLKLNLQSAKADTTRVLQISQLANKYGFYQPDCGIA